MKFQWIGYRFSTAFKSFMGWSNAERDCRY